MRLVAISFDISSSARKIIQNIAGNIFHCPVDVFDLKCSEPEVNVTDTILLFGKKSTNLFIPRGAQQILQLPELSQLEPGNEKIREQTYQQLLSFSQNIKNQKIISQATLPDLPKNELQAIEQRLKEKKENKWIGKTKDGRSIEIQLNAKESTADIAITFSELYALKTVMKLLDIDELIIK
jgi:hypothetical protein